MMENKELDKWLAENVMEWKKEEQAVIWNSTVHMWEHALCWLQKPLPVRVSDWRPTISISDAFQVVEKMYENDFWFSCAYKQEHGISSGIEGYFTKFRCVRGATRGEHEGYSTKLPESICLAAKKAVEGEDK